MMLLKAPDSRLVPSGPMMAQNAVYSVIWLEIYLLNKQWAREVLAAHPVHKRAGQACARLAALLTRHAVLLLLHGALSYRT